MKFYLQRHDGTVSDSGDYPEQPADRDEGIWQAGDPPAGSREIQPLSERLRQIFEQELSSEVQADLSPLKAAVKMEMEQTRYEIARLIIQRASIPVELESIRAQLLALLPQPPDTGG